MFEELAAFSEGEAISTIFVSARPWHSYPLGMQDMRIRRFIILALLIGWVVLNPVTVAFGGCIGMGAPCHAPCVMMSHAVLPTTSLMIPQAGMTLPTESPAVYPTPALKVPTRPPKSSGAFLL
jgi:hypothetical protein